MWINCSSHCKDFANSPHWILTFWKFFSGSLARTFLFSHSRWDKKLKQTPCWTVLDFWKIKLQKSISTKWIFSVQKLILKLIFAGYTGSKSQVQNRLKIQFVELDYSKFIFQKSSMDQQGESTNLQFYKLLFQPFFSKHNIYFLPFFFYSNKS